MKFRPFLVPAIMLTVTGGLLAWLLLAEPPEVDDAQSAASAPQDSSIATTDITDQDASAVPLPQDIRDVSPEGVSAPQVTGTLTRIDPSKRYLELRNPPAEEIGDGPIELTRVQVLDGGRIRTDKLTVTLAHIQPLQPDETCVSKLGGQWPCGARARTFLRGLIRHLKVSCEMTEELGPGHIRGTCSRGNIDLGERMVRYGWADPAPDAPPRYANLAQTAREKTLGKWQSELVATLPEVNSDYDTGVELPGLKDLVPEIVEWSLQADPEEAGQVSAPANPDNASGQLQ
ncbi:thermonuclease family protein [Roseibium salinum]|uniref:Thermonuclease family protein n=1 Tax=Roseibium salinum TaxID=1604349 RepID=A0ABT3R3L4_9HYPH|nr:thermonuclease family protein [Roseibium sp. DSM 29163]MCX2723653.1 thermonuclease family protein [Roseibium sp. DSM 29163]MDN3718482.1 thermonuclease family protein [Roseibium salinum]